MKPSFKLFLVFFVFVLCCNTNTFAQVPQSFNYQGVARDSKGNPLIYQKIALKLSVLPAADALKADYEEVQEVTTNEFGLYTLQIGKGDALTGQMKTVDWETGNKFIRVAIDPAGGRNFTEAGTTQLLSVPYAIYADKAGHSTNDGKNTRTGGVSSNATHVAGDVNFLSKFSALNTIGKSLIFDNGTSVGIGTASPSALSKVHLLTTTGNIEHLRMQNTNSAGFGKFVMYNDIGGNYASFTKYGSAVPGGYAGIAATYPFANMLAFGNNNGPFLLVNSGNIGIGIVTGGTTKLYFNAQQSTGYLGIGSSFVPSANVHFGNTTTGDTLKVTNTTTGHLTTDGLDIRTTGNAAAIMNRENSTLTLGTNNSNVISITNAGRTDFSGQIKIAGGAPGANKVLTSDATGIANWQTPSLSNIIPGTNAGDVLVWNGSAWIATPKCNLFSYFFRDADGDGFGDKFNPVYGCSALPGFVSDSTDCNDGNNAVNPNTVWFQDSDADNFGNPNSTLVSCLQPNGYTANNQDCNDNNASITLGDTYFQDLDNDNFGNPAVSVVACTQPVGFVANGLDCNDANVNITIGVTYFRDLDGDLFGDDAFTVNACSQPPGFVTIGFDCDDDNQSVNPNAVEVCNTIDDDCDGAVDEGFNLNTNINNCGFCGNVCNLPHATPACTAGQCEIASCNPGFMDVNNNPNDGCEVNLSTHCVISGQVFPNGTTNPGNQCQVCNTLQNSTNWSNKPNGTSCSGGTCANGTCVQ